jgi:sugar phosphate isomerase/epimerase
MAYNIDPSRISACTYPLRDRPVAEAMETIAAAGFRRIDLLGRMPHLSLDPDECNLDDLKALAARNGLAIANLGTYSGKGFASADHHVRAETLSEVKRAVDAAVILGARSIRVSPGDERPENLDRIVPWFKQAAAYAEEKRIYMGFENHGGAISSHPALCRELAEKVGSKFFGVLYEPCNLMTAGTDYREALEVLRSYVVHTHFKDGRTTPDGFRLTMLGAGEIDFRWIVKRLDAAGYRGDFAFEYELESPPVAAGLKEWYKAALEM